MKTATAKRILFVLVAAVLFSAFCPVIVAPAAAEAEAYEDPRFTAVFPSSLRTVGEEAFYGTSIGTAVFQDGLAQIGERAFLNADRLAPHISRKAQHSSARTLFLIPLSFTASRGATPSAERKNMGMPLLSVIFVLCSRLRILSCCRFCFILSLPPISG